MGTRLHLVRHGHTAALGRTLSGRSPIGLSETGRAQAEAVGHHLTGYPIGRLLTSPQPRALQTAQAIGRALRLSETLDPALDEVDFGGWAGQTFDALTPDPAWQAWNRQRSLAPSPGETMLAVQTRVVALLQRVSAAWPERDVVLVSHADVLRALLAYLLGMPIDLMQRLDLSPAGRSVVVLTEWDIVIEAVNLPPALP